MRRMLALRTGCIYFVIVRCQQKSGVVLLSCCFRSHSCHSARFCHSQFFSVWRCHGPHLPGFDLLQTRVVTSEVVGVRGPCEEVNMRPRQRLDKFDIQYTESSHYPYYTRSFLFINFICDDNHPIMSWMTTPELLMADSTHVPLKANLIKLAQDGELLLWTDVPKDAGPGCDRSCPTLDPHFELFGWPCFHERAFLPIFHDPFLFPYSLLLRDTDPVIETCGHAECWSLRVHKVSQQKQASNPRSGIIMLRDPGASCPT